MRRFLISSMAALLLTIASSSGAVAGTKWCAVDPIITVDGRTSDVTVSFEEPNLAAVLPPVMFRFHVPANSVATISLPPAAVAYTVELAYDLPARGRRDPVAVRVDTLVPATSTFVVNTVVLLPRNVTISVAGLSNAVTSMTYSVK